MRRVDLASALRVRALEQLFRALQPSHTVGDEELQVLPVPQLLARLRFIRTCVRVCVRKCTGGAAGATEIDRERERACACENKRGDAPSYAAQSDSNPSLSSMRAMGRMRCVLLGTEGSRSGMKGAGAGRCRSCRREREGGREGGGVRVRGGERGER
jgi:hypothetical protein